MIFEYVHNINKSADETEGIIRISIDTKTGVKIGPFSRGGYSRTNVKAQDHDHAPKTIVKPFGINIPVLNENYIYFTQSNVTADFMIDALEDLWPSIQKRFDPHTLVINADNGPENSSRRSQFMKRLIGFAHAYEINISLAYYPPYHSKYNPIERVWGVLENHWNGELLDSVEKALGLARTMTYNKNKPIVKYVKGIYEKGVKLSKKAHEKLETMIERIAGVEKWAVNIPCYQ